MKIRKLIAVLGLVLASIVGAGSAWAVPISPIYASNTGGVLDSSGKGYNVPLNLAPGAYTVTLFYNSLAGTGGGNPLGVLPLAIGASGSVTMTAGSFLHPAPYPNAADGILVGTSTTTDFIANLSNGGAIWTTNFEVGTIGITVAAGAGSLDLLLGNPSCTGNGTCITDVNFNTIPVSGNILTAATIPEPGTLLLIGFGLSGITIVGRSRKS